MSVDWALFDDWNLVVATASSSPRPAPTPPRGGADWAAMDELLEAFAAVVKRRYHELARLLDDWDRVLGAFGGDPTRRDWTQFRPLRLSREEDWSDWLAYLIESSDTGIFASVLLGGPTSDPRDFARPVRTTREVAHDDCRADLIIEWCNGKYSHVEVKVGDPNLAKTFSTSAAMRLRYAQPPERWSNFILLLSRQTMDWEGVAGQVTGEPPVNALTWDGVCVALRRALQSDEQHLWKAFAYAMTGAIEQVLVGYPGFRFADQPVDNIESKIQILALGLLNA